MSLHGLLSVTIGVPNVEQTAAYYADFGLTPEDDNWFATADGGRQLHIVPAATRRLVELRVAADDADDIARTAASLARLGIQAEMGEGALETSEPVTGMRVRVEIVPRLVQDTVPATRTTGQDASTGRRCAPRASCARIECARASSAMPCWAAPIMRPARPSSPTDSGSR